MSKYPTSLSKYFEMAGHQPQILILQFEQIAKTSIIEYSEELVDEKLDYIREKDLIDRFPSLVSMSSYDRSGLVGGINLFLIDNGRLNSITRHREQEREIIYQLLRELVKDRGKLNAVTKLRGDEIVLNVENITTEFLSNFPQVVEKFRRQMSVKKLFDPTSSLSNSRVMGNCPLLCYERGHPDGTIQNCVVFLAMSVPERVDFIDNNDRVNRCCLIIYGHNEEAPCPDTNSGCVFCWDKSHHSSLCDKTMEARSINSIGCVLNRKKLHDMQTGGYLYTNPPPGFPNPGLSIAVNSEGEAAVLVQAKRNLRWEFSDKLHTDSMILNLVLSFLSDRLLTRRHVQIREDGYLSVNIQEITLNLLEKNYSESFDNGKRLDGNAMLMVKASPAAAVLQKFIEISAGPLSNRIEVLDLLPSYLSADFVRRLDTKSSVLWEQMCDQFGRQDSTNDDNSIVVVETDRTIRQEQLERIEKQKLLLDSIRDNINANFREMHSINAGLQSSIKQLWHRYSGLRMGNAMSPVAVKKLEMDNIFKLAGRLTKSLNLSRVDLMRHFHNQNREKDAPATKINEVTSASASSDVWQKKVNEQLKIIQDRSLRGKNLFENGDGKMNPFTIKMSDASAIQDIESDSTDESDESINKQRKRNAGETLTEAEKQLELLRVTDEMLTDAEKQMERLKVTEPEPEKDKLVKDPAKESSKIYKSNSRQACPLVGWKHEHWGLSLGHCSLFRGLSPENRRRAVRILDIPQCCLSDEIHALGHCGQIVTCRFCQAKAHSSLLCYSKEAVSNNEKIYLMYKAQNMRNYPQISSATAYEEFEEQCSVVDVRCDSDEMQDILGLTSDENCGAVWETTHDDPEGQVATSGEQHTGDDDDPGEDDEVTEEVSALVTNSEEENSSSATKDSTEVGDNNTASAGPSEPEAVLNDGGPDDCADDGSFNFLPLFSTPGGTARNLGINDCKYVIFRLDDDGTRHEIELEQVCPGTKEEGAEGIYCERGSWKYWDHIMHCTTIGQLNSLVRSGDGKFYVIGDPNLYEDLQMLAEEAENAECAEDEEDDDSIPDLEEQELPEDSDTSLSPVLEEIEEDEENKALSSDPVLTCDLKKEVKTEEYKEKEKDELTEGEHVPEHSLKKEDMKQEPIKEETKEKKGELPKQESTLANMEDSLMPADEANEERRAMIEKLERLEERSASDEELHLTNRISVLRSLREKIWRSRSNPSLDIDNRESLQNIVIKKEFNPPLRRIVQHDTDPISSHSRTRYATLTHKQACSDCLLSTEEFEELRALILELERHGEVELDPFSSADENSEPEEVKTDTDSKEKENIMAWTRPKGDPDNTRMTIFPEKVYIEQKTEDLSDFAKNSLETATADALLIQLELTHHLREKAASFFSQFSYHPMICKDGIMVECRDLLEDMQKKFEALFSKKKAEESGELNYENVCMAQEEDISSSEQENNSSTRSKLDVFFGTGVPLTEETIRGEQTNAWDMESMMCEESETQLHYIEAESALAKYLDSNINGMSCTSSLFTICEIFRLLLFIFWNKNIREPANRYMVVCDEETESCFNVRCFHLSQLQRMIAKMVKIAGRDVSTRTAEELPLFLPPPEKRKKIKSKKKMRIVKNVNANFYVKPDFLELLRTLPRVDPESAVFSYYDLADLLGEYLVERKSEFQAAAAVIFLTFSLFLANIQGCKIRHFIVQNYFKVQAWNR